jgi:steroid delta-isomerase-like uncharacterized protein
VWDMHSGDSELVRRYIERVWNNGDMVALNELTLPNFKYFLGGQPARDREAFAQFIKATRTGFPDWRVEVDQVIAEPGAIAVRWHGQASHDGAFRGLAPTHRAVSVCGINIYSIENGKVAAEWEQTDTLGMLQQLGVLPS